MYRSEYGLTRFSKKYIQGNKNCAEIMPAAAAAAAAGACARPLQPHEAPDFPDARNPGQGGRSVNDLHRLLVKRLCSAATVAWNSSAITRRQNETHKLTGKSTN